jgi:hypothetical protein
MIESGRRTAIEETNMKARPSSLLLAAALGLAAWAASGAEIVTVYKDPG